MMTQTSPNPKSSVKRALTQLGGEVEVWCDSNELGATLAQVLQVEPDEAQPSRHVHGFHSYPARMHPDTALRLVEALTEPGQVVLDPFCGSGTVLVEARLTGRVAYGIDANPLSVALANLKLCGLDSAEKQEFLIGVSKAVAEFADDRRRAKAGPSRSYSRQERAQFSPHVLLELDGLMKGINELCPPALMPALRLVISSMLTKFSIRRSDTSGHEVAKRIASGFTIQFFLRKTTELARRLSEYSALLPKTPQPAEAKLGDARLLPMKDGRAQAIITSPPYPGVYDYVEHHRLRLDFLGLDAKHLERHEIGAHRDFALAEPEDAEAKWAEQFGACLSEMRRVLTPNGKIALLIADSVVARRPFYADRAIKNLARQQGLTVIYGGSQRRSHFHAPTRDAFREAPRREHLIVLARDENASAKVSSASHQNFSKGATRTNVRRDETKRELPRAYPSKGANVRRDQAPPRAHAAKAVHLKRDTAERKLDVTAPDKPKNPKARAPFGKRRK